MKRVFFYILLTLLPMTLGGCGSIAKGVTEAVLEKKKEDTRLCEISGPTFDGVKQSIAKTQGSSRETKVLMVHGIGKHLPDYSARFREKLVRELALTSMDADIPEIHLTTEPGKDGLSAGLLRVRRYSSPTDNRSLVFYELTWSALSDEEKKVLAFDDSEAYAYRRAMINKSLKSFMNSTVPDLLVYQGKGKEQIDKSVGQSMCWMFKSKWEDLPRKGVHYCDPTDPEALKHLGDNDYFVVTHSLGSRIVIDKFNAYALSKKQCTTCDRNAHDPVKDQTFTIYMLANQLPLLQVGQPRPTVTGKIAEYCTPSGPRSDERLAGKMLTVAFSDPNDILSYPIPHNYADEYIDSRLCPEVVNVDINVAETAGMFGVDFANPLEAHGGYLEDDRTVKIIAEGLQKNNQDPLLAERCHWTEITRKETQ